MKKTIRINLAGLVFNIDEDAFQKLDSYLKAIEKKFSGTEDGHEIVSDIEARIAELLREKAPTENEAVSMHHVEFVIDTMGRPDDYDDESASENFEKQSSTKANFWENLPFKNGLSKRRLFRDPDNRYLGGVASGIAAYFGLPASYIRIAFAVLILFASVPIIIFYTIFWIAIPEAKTSAQKLEMKGEKVNLDNIESTIKSEFHTVKNKWNNFQNSEKYKQALNYLDNFLETAYNLFKNAFKFLGKAIAIVLLITGITLLASLMGLLFMGDNLVQLFPHANIQTLDTNTLLGIFTDTRSALIIQIGAFLSLAMPILLIIYTAYRWLFPFHTKSKVFAAVGVSLWIVGVVFLFLGVTTSAVNFSKSASSKSNYDIVTPKDTVYINSRFLSEAAIPSSKQNLDFEDVKFIFNNNQAKVYRKPKLNIIKSNEASTKLEMQITSQGKSKSQAREAIEQINYDWQQQDSVLVFEPYFTIGNHKWRDQDLKLNLYIPIGSSIYLTKEALNILNNIELEDYKSYSELSGKYWIMTEKGLQLSGKQTTEEVIIPKTEQIKDTTLLSQDSIKAIEKKLESL